MNVKLLFALLALDLLWISLFMMRPFSDMIQDVQKGPLEFRASGAIVAYVCLYLLASTFLPKTSNDLEAFLLGFLVYGVYDSTNYATLTNWNPAVALIDSLWGGLLFYLLKQTL